MTTTKKDMSALEVMKTRTSVRKYEKGHVMPKEDLEEILNLTVTAPSSWNLQHWKFIVIDKEEDKQRLLPIAYNQEQVVDSSVTVAVLGDLQANENAEIVYGEAVKKGFMPEEAKNTLIAQINGAYASIPNAARDEAIRNGSLAAMQLMLAAKSLGYDTVPMGGYDSVKFVEEFNVPERYVPVMLISIGKAAAPAHPTPRFPLKDVIL
ncbi:nitroreductase family protein [Cytobacillus sp. IB215665]|uniref:nitroreductase family protein n=1 Tax=Cytobacillus sp. IB215665 TaxID=3097357 RepID=UPI002A0B32D2|nr:nitroreductase family protein [Cytobacillus sp. IB215665]MDX8367365.1 nitroreductase family protein [Cytobacillus sp. IB215665]